MSALVDVDLVLCMVTLPPLPVFPNSYMLDSCLNKQKDRWGGLKTPHHQELKLNTKCSENREFRYDYAFFGGKNK